MIKSYTNTKTISDIFKKPSNRSEIVSQMIYGENFFIIKKVNEWLKIKTKNDNYVGYIQNKNYSKQVNPTHKIISLRANIYKLPNKKKASKLKLSFNSKIKVTESKNKFFKFEKGWIEKNQVKPVNYKDKDPFEKIQIFKNVKYKWGGKSFKGIDCSALVQICLNFNNRYCPRDTKDQVKFFKKGIRLNNIKKNNIIFWKGHVAVALSRKKVIHAYGPLKKTVIMDLQHTINRIKKTAKLKVTKIIKL
tara:strand:+ start:967 stop:1710 length:744 start_codon:yes stop_codon:yes gene_type:complete